MFSRETRQRRVRKLIPILKEEYPDTSPMLNFSNALELLIASILAAQCTDKKVNEVTGKLFEKYKSARDYAEADLEELMEEIYSTGTFRRKAARIKDCCEALARLYNGEVPGDIEVLTALPGIGRKTANLVLADCFGLPGIIMDTHVIRVSKRLGLTDKDYPDKMEDDLMAVVAEKNWSDFSRLLASHGRAICVARRPRCRLCKVSRVCDYYRANRPVPDRLAAH